MFDSVSTSLTAAHRETLMIGLVHVRLAVSKWRFGMKHDLYKEQVHPCSYKNTVTISVILCDIVCCDSDPHVP